MRFKFFIFLLFLFVFLFSPKLVLAQGVVTASASLKNELPKKDFKIVSLKKNTQTLASLLPVKETVSFDKLLPRMNSALLDWFSNPLSKYELPNYDNLIYIYAKKYNVNPNLLREMAYCESSFNPRAKNGIYQGLYQFSPTTWRSNRKAMGLNSDPDLRTNPEEMIKTTAFKINHDGNVNAWPECGVNTLHRLGKIRFGDE